MECYLFGSRRIIYSYSVSIGITRAEDSQVKLIFVVALSRNVEKEFSKVYELVQKISDSPVLIEQLQRCPSSQAVLHELLIIMQNLRR